MMPFCPSCGDLRDDDWRFCRGCGSERFPAPDATNRAFCTRCGELMGRDWKHCRACGFAAPSDPAIQSSAPPILPAVEPEAAPGSDAKRDAEPANPETPAERTPLQSAPQTPPTPPAPPSFEPTFPEPRPEAPTTPQPRPRSEQADSVEESIRRRFAAAASQVDRAEPMPTPEPEPEPPRPVPFELIAVPDLPERESVQTLDEDDPDEASAAFEPPPTVAQPSGSGAASFDDEDLPPLPDIPSFAPFPDLDDQPRVELISPQAEVIDVEASPFRESLSETRPWSDDDDVDPGDLYSDDVAAEEPSMVGHGPLVGAPMVDTDTLTAEDSDEDSSAERAIPRPVVASDAPGARRVNNVASALQILWLIAGTASVLLTAGLIMLNLRLEDFRRTGDFTPTETLSRTIDTIFTTAVIASVVLSLAATAWWTLRENGNRLSRDGHESRYTSKQIVAGWLIPGVNLVAPPVFIHDLWKRSNAKNKVNLWIVSWWVLLITFGIGLIWIGRLPSASVEDSLDANAYAAITYGFLIAACLAAVGMVSSVATDRAERSKTEYDL